MFYTPPDQIRQANLIVLLSKKEGCGGGMPGTRMGFSWQSFF